MVILSGAKNLAPRPILRSAQNDGRYIRVKPALGKDAVHHVAGDVGQTEIAALVAVR